MHIAIGWGAVNAGVRELSTRTVEGCMLYLVVQASTLIELNCKNAYQVAGNAHYHMPCL